MKNSRGKFFLMVLATCFCTACLGKGPFPVKGKLTSGGEPVHQAMIQFIPEPGSPSAEGSRAPYATTDADGNYTMTTFAFGDGAFAGAYKVTIIKEAPSKRLKEDPKGLDLEANGPPLSMLEIARMTKPFKRKSSLPEVYNSVETTPFKVEIPRGGNTDLNFELAP